MPNSDKILRMLARKQQSVSINEERKAKSKIMRQKNTLKGRQNKERNKRKLDNEIKKRSKDLESTL